MIRLNQLMMGFSVVVGCLIIGIQNTPKLWHQFQLWQHSGVTCEQSTEDGKATRYGNDCS
ncbi:hypothetical protein ACQ4M3_12415 [Leptolyngbya sp. AN03gr2]|uniref:hypothetical protein n=1 Tax=unclassified Leptolyngbya TaxID=2650499 RepID=UPI003D314F2D